MPPTFALGDAVRIHGIGKHLRNSWDFVERGEPGLAGLGFGCRRIGRILVAQAEQRSFNLNLRKS
jgi:hypothetical protein